jgi:hypothetical protein
MRIRIKASSQTIIAAGNICDGSGHIFGCKLVLHNSQLTGKVCERSWRPGIDTRRNSVSAAADGT